MDNFPRPYRKSKSVANSRFGAATPFSEGFFSLPLEIRKQIYIFVFHRGILYFNQFDQKPPNNKGKKRQPPTRQELVGRATPIYTLHPPYHLEVDTTSDRSELEKRWFSEHPSCSLQPKDGYEVYHKPRVDCPDKLHMGLLRTCRQIHAEAGCTVWSTNLFHFGDPDTFTKVIKGIRPANRAALKRLTLGISWAGQSGNQYSESTGKWSLAISNPLLKGLSGLRTLSLEINIEISDTNLMSTRYGVSLDAHIEAFDAFATLALETVEINIGSREIRPDNPYWNIEDHEQYARNIRAKLTGDESRSLSSKETERQMVERYRFERLKRLLHPQDRRRAIPGRRARYHQ